MIRWMAYWVWWFIWRMAVTFACLFTIQNVIHQEGYYIAWPTLCAAAACSIVGIRIWMPSCKYPKRTEDDNS